MTKLLSELAPVADLKDPDFISFTYEDVKDLPYLQACIDEALRLHSTSAIGLPRVVPEGGAVVCDQFFPGGMTLSVPVRRSPDCVESMTGVADHELYSSRRLIPSIEILQSGATIPKLIDPNGRSNG